MAKQKTFVVTKYNFDSGLELRNQYIIKARSEKEAMELAIYNEKIEIQEVSDEVVNTPEVPRDPKPVKK